MLWLQWTVFVLGIIGTITALTWITVRRAVTCRPPIFGPVVLAVTGTVAVSISWPMPL